MSADRFCLIGQVLVDVSLTGPRAPWMRLGGIAHAARALWAVGATYSVGYIAPTYLDKHAREFLAAHGAEEIVRIGEVDGAPNVILIGRPDEAGPQGYELLLRDRHRVRLDLDAANTVFANSATTDVLLFPDSHYLGELGPLLPGEPVRVYVDADIDFAELESAGVSLPIQTAILSTSSQAFGSVYEASVESLSSRTVGHVARSFLFKENRGGSRFFTAQSVTTTPAQLRPIIHSVGVGDCFDCAFAVLRRRHDDPIALAYAAAIAAEYAASTDPNQFRAAVEATLAIPEEEIATLSGVVLPWEERARFSIYIAAPDFEHVRHRDEIDRLVEALRYHGFTPRLPVREHGELDDGASRRKRQETVAADMRLLAQCEMIVAVLLYNDPGTLVEIGIGLERGMPVVVYDPLEIARNAVLTELPGVVTTSLGETVTAVFEQAGRR